MSEQTIHHIFSRMTREEKKEFLAKEMSDMGAESLVDVLLELPLRDIPSTLKARIIFRLGITAVGHSYWLQSSGVQVWEFPQVPPALRPFITAVSRLVGEFEAAMASAINGRGDYAKVVVLLNPERIEQLGQEIRGTVLDYAAELRTASGRNRRPSRQKAQGEGKDTEPAEQVTTTQAAGENGSVVQGTTGTGTDEDESSTVPVPDTDAPEETGISPADATEEKAEDAEDSTPAKAKRKRSNAKAADEAITENDASAQDMPEADSNSQPSAEPGENGAFAGLFDSLFKAEEQEQ